MDCPVDGNILLFGSSSVWLSHNSDDAAYHRYREHGTPNKALLLVYPDQLTLTDAVVGTVTLYPYGTLCIAGSGSSLNYIGSINYTYGAACGCAGGTVELQYAYNPCISASSIAFSYVARTIIN